MIVFFYCAWYDHLFIIISLSLILLTFDNLYQYFYLLGIIIFLYFLLRALGTENFLNFIFELETVRESMMINIKYCQWKISLFTDAFLTPATMTPWIPQPPRPHNDPSSSSNHKWLKYWPDCWLHDPPPSLLVHLAWAKLDRLALLQVQLSNYDDDIIWDIMIIMMIIIPQDLLSLWTSWP